MSGLKKAEKLLLEKTTKAALALKKEQRGIDIGQLIALIRSQLGMSQRALAKRAKVPQSNLSKIESGLLKSNMQTLQKILDAMECDLLITAIPRGSPEEIRKKQATAKARKKIQYLKGTMSLEKQAPSKEFLEEVVNDETKRILNLKSSKLWEKE
jgi:transcriptional regulator with XRE-family HTH domain